jgi:hypothetical protein
VVEGTGLENRQACKRLEGSNPSPSAIFIFKSFRRIVFIPNSGMYPQIYPRSAGRPFIGPWLPSKHPHRGGVFPPGLGTREEVVATGPHPLFTVVRPILDWHKLRALPESIIEMSLVRDQR